MGLPSEIISQFVKISKPEKPVSEGKVVTGTAKEYAGKIYVQLDGSDQLTPVISSTAGMKDGDRVTVLIKDHSASVTGNVSSPSTGQDDLDKVEEEIGNKISEFEIVIADKVSVKEFDAEKARIDNLVAENVTINGKLDAVEANIGDLNADNVTINEKLEAQNADIENLKATKLDAEIADIKYATIENLEATNANIHNLEADYGDFKELTSDKITANEAAIKRLDTEKLSAKEAELKYANIDFANIGSAAIENFLSKSGMIGDLVVGDGTVTGTLVGVTIKGDLIEGGTVVADKLVIKGEDGLYYKLNTDGETVGSEQTEYNSLNGSIITAKSVTAEKISVNDLVAFDATIGGFNITESSIYSGVKKSVDNTTRGIYMDDDGQFAIGDSNNYLKYFKMEDGTYKLALSVGGSSIDDAKATDKKSGYLVDIGPNAGKPPIDVVVYGDTKQNLWKNPSGTSNGMTVTSNADGSMALRGTASTTSVVLIRSYVLEAGKTYVATANKQLCSSFVDGKTGAKVSIQEFNDNSISLSDNIFAVPGVLKKIFKVSERTSYAYFRIVVYANTEMNVSKFRVMLREATEDEIAAAQLSSIPADSPELLPASSTPDTPTVLPEYPGAIAATSVFDWVKPGINGAEPSGVCTSGNNMFVPPVGTSLGVTVTSSASTGEITISGTATATNSIWSDSAYSVRSGYSYLAAANKLSGTRGIVVRMYDSFGDIIEDIFFAGSQNKTLRVEFTPKENVVKVRFGIAVTQGSSYSVSGLYVKVRLLDAPTSIFDKPLTSSLPIDLKSYQLYMLPDGTRDYFHTDDSSTTIVKNVGDTIFTGKTEEKWYLSEEYNKRFYCALPDSVPESDLTNGVYSICDTLPLLIAGGTAIAGATGYTIVANKIYVSVNGVNTLEDFKSWLSKNPIHLLYKLNTPQNINLDLVTLPALPADYAYAWAASDIPAYMDVTYWTVAGKDVSDKINDAQNSANDANNKIDEQLPNIEYARSQIEILNKSIATLVVDENGGSLMTQTSDGWKFNIGEIQSTLDDAMSGIQDVKGDVAGIEDLANKTNDLANDVAKKTAYINMTQDESGAPVMELGQQDGEFKLRITNTSMDFMQGSQRIAYLSNRQLYIQSSVVTDEMKIGATSGYIWKKRANGNMGLRYVTE